MDFVVVGLGLGTLAILAGVLTLVGVAGRWERAAARATTPEDAAHDHAVAAGRRGAGQALIGAGIAVLIATIGALAGSLDDQTGAFFVTTTATVAALGLLVWAYLYRSRNPLPTRRRVWAGAGDGGRETEDGRRGSAVAEASGEPEPSVAELALQDDEPAADVEASEEDVPATAPIPAEVSDSEPEPVAADADAIDDEPHDLPDQPDPAMNGASDAPLALPEREHADDREGQRDRKA